MTKGNGPVDLAKLRKIYKNDGTARALLDHFAERERFFTETTVERLRQNLEARGVPASAAQIRQSLDALEKIGAGELRIGRKGHQTRFVWAVNNVQLGVAARGESEQVDSANGAMAEPAGAQFLTHEFRLRPDVVLRLETPFDLTANEASRISDWVRTLPFST